LFDNQSAVVYVYGGYEIHSYYQKCKQLMKTVLTFCLLLSALFCKAQKVEDYFESIRNNPAKLTAFFSQMPKGGDLHHHYSGSVYAETYLDYVIAKDYFINLQTLEVKERPVTGDTGFVRFTALGRSGLATAKQNILQKWSVKDYNGVSYPSDKLFFETFPNFNIASSNTFDEGLTEIKNRAKLENVSYIETMFTSIKANVKLDSFEEQRRQIEEYYPARNAKELVPVFEKLFLALADDATLKSSVVSFNKELAERHNRLRLDDSSFTLRYQNYVVRVTSNPVELFKNLLVAFESASQSKLIVGVNIVAPEDNEISMKYYWLHMQLFRFFGTKYPDVKYAMHAGELALGMVKPEELTWHINAAVRDAGADRIGHGVDLPYETDAYSLLEYMSANDVAVEINLFSNEFILKVKEDHHPLMLYKQFKVPIVICTDDAGVLRSNLIHQYVLLATRYKNLTYRDIKKMVFNSIKYSFIEEETRKSALNQDLKNRFRRFESKVLEYAGNP